MYEVISNGKNVYVAESGENNIPTAYDIYTAYDVHEYQIPGREPIKIGYICIDQVTNGDYGAALLAWADNHRPDSEGWTLRHDENVFGFVAVATDGRVLELR